MKKKMVAVSLVLSLMGTLAGCSASGGNVDDRAEQKHTDIVATSGGDNEADPGVEFVYVMQDSANPYFIQVYDGFQSECAELEVKTQILDSKYNVTTRISYAEDAVQRNVDGIMVPPLDKNASKTTAGQAKEKGTAVSAEAQSVSNAQVDGSLDEYNIGYTIGNAVAEWVKAKQGGKGGMLILVQDDVEAIIRRGNGINDGILENAPEAEVAARQNTSNTDLGMRATESVLLAKSGINAIRACDGSTAIDVYKTILAIQKVPDSSYIGGCDVTGEGEGKMKVENSVYRSSCNPFPCGAGEDLTEAVYKYLTEKQESTVIQRRYELV